MAGLTLDPLTLDALETRSPAARAEDLAEALPRVLARGALQGAAAGGRRARGPH